MRTQTHKAWFLEEIFVGALLFVTHTRQAVFPGVKRGSFVLLHHVGIIFE